MSVIGWWGIGSLLWMHRFFAGKDTPPDNAAWYGLITASLLVAWMARTWFEGMEWFYVLIACIPVAAYWAWLSKKNFVCGLPPVPPPGRRPVTSCCPHLESHRSVILCPCCPGSMSGFHGSPSGRS
jgi:hypothetical protein